jgi:hypothetical protein
MYEFSGDFSLSPFEIRSPVVRKAEEIGMMVISAGAFSLI